jgi:hypothetical protein
MYPFVYKKGEKEKPALIYNCIGQRRLKHFYMNLLVFKTDVYGTI